MTSTANSKPSDFDQDLLDLIELCRKNEREYDYEALRTNATRLGQVIVKEPSSPQQLEITAFAFRWVGHSTLECAREDSSMEASIQFAQSCIEEIKKLNLKSPFPHEAHLKHIVFEELSELEESGDIKEGRKQLLEIDQKIDKAIKVHRASGLEDLAILLRIRSDVQSDLACWADEDSPEEFEHQALADELLEESIERHCELAGHKMQSPADRKQAFVSVAFGIVLLVLSVIFRSL